MITPKVKKGLMSSAILWALLAAALMSVAVAQTKLIPLVTGGPQQGAFQSRYLTINYSYTLNQGQLNVSGKLNFDDSLTMTYPGLRHFYMELVLVDSQGHVVERTNVALKMGFTWGDNDAVAASSFTAQLPVPPGTASMTFYYNGATRGALGAGAGTAFWNDPVSGKN